MYAPILVCYSFSFFLLILLLSRPYLLCTVTISNIDVDVGAFFNDWLSNKFRLDDMPRGRDGTGSVTLTRDPTRPGTPVTRDPD